MRNVYILFEECMMGITGEKSCPVENNFYIRNEKYREKSEAEILQEWPRALLLTSRSRDTDSNI